MWPLKRAHKFHEAVCNWDDVAHWRITRYDKDGLFMWKIMKQPFPNRGQIPEKLYWY